MNSKEVHEKTRNRIMVLCLLLLLAVKQIVTAGLPIYVIGDAGYDDQLMVAMAQQIRSGQWMGPYTDMTLVKGWFFPLFLAVLSRLGLSYLSVTTLIYSLSCVFLAAAVKPAVKNRILTVLLAAFLIFSPISTSGAVVQRLYRNGVSLWQVNFILAGYFGLFLRLKEKGGKRLFWALLAAAGIISFWHTREDAMWMLPFVVVVTLVLLVLAFLNHKEGTIGRAGLIGRILVILLPLLLFAGANEAVARVNEHFYGIRTVNELSGSHFADAIKAIYSVKAGEEVPYTSVSKEKRETLYRISPSLAGIREELEDALQLMGKVDRNPDDEETEDGWFFWALRLAARNAGFHETAAQADAFYLQMAKEIQAAIEAGEAVRQPVMPSALMSPWREEYAEALPGTMAEALIYMVRQTDTEPWMRMSEDGEPWMVYDAERIAGDHALYEPGDQGYISGWYMNADLPVNAALSLRVLQDGKEIQKTSFVEAGDLRKTFGQEYFAGRFAVAFPVPEKTGTGHFTLQIVDSKGKELLTVPAFSGKNASTGDTASLHLDYTYFPVDTVGVWDAADRAVTRLRAVDQYYWKYFPYLSAFAAAVFMMLTLLMLVKTAREKWGGLWLMALACIASLLVLLAGVAYTHLSAFEAVFATYLSGGYPCLFLAEGLMVIAAWRMTGGLLWEKAVAGRNGESLLSGLGKRKKAKKAKTDDGDQAVAVMKNIRCRRGKRMLKGPVKGKK